MISWDRQGHRVIGVFTPRQIRWLRDHALLEGLPTTGGVVILENPRVVWSWIWSIHECGVRLASRVGVAWGPLQVMDERAEGRAGRSFVKVMAWLMTVVDGLIDVADLPCPSEW